MARKTVVVTGHAKGGTSMVAGMIQILGVQMNERPKGEINTMEDEIGLVLHRPDPLRQVIDRKDRTFDLWGFKWPKMVDFLQERDGFFTRPRYVFVTRDPVANTNRAPEGTQLQAMRAVLDSHGKMIAFAEKFQDANILWLSYERTLNDPHTAVRRLAGFLELAENPRREFQARNFARNVGDYRPIVEFLTDSQPIPGGSYDPAADARGGEQ